MSDEQEKIESIILRILGEIRDTMATKAELAEMRAGMNTRFDEVDLRFVKIEGRLGNLEEVTRTTLDQVVKLAGKVEYLETGLRIAARLADVEKRLDAIEATKH